MQKYVNFGKPVACCLSLSLPFFPLSLLAAEPDVVNQSNQQTIETMTVTASQKTEPITNLISPSIEITREQIEAQQAKTVMDVLRLLPGVQLSNNGGDNQQSRIYVRGRADVVVLFNGMRLGSATAGYLDVSQLPLVGIEKIEYLRGAQAAAYGADASAGVINFITEPNSQGISGKIQAKIGSDGYQDYSASIAKVEQDNYWLSLSAQSQQADGYNIATFGSNDDDGYDNTNVIVDAGVNVNDRWQVRVNGYSHQAQTQYDDASSNPQSNVDIYSVNGQVLYQGEQLISRLSFGQTKDQMETVPSSYDAKFITQRQEINWRNHWQFDEKMHLGFGAEYINDDVSDSDTAYEVTSRDNRAVYMSLGFDDQTWQFEGNVRLDSNEQFGDKATWQLGAGYQFTDALRATAQAGTGFKAPNFNDLYFPGFSNPNLQAETSTNYEVALEGVHNGFDWRLSGFHQSVENRISCQSVYSQCINDNVEIKGVEWQGSFATGALTHQVSLEYLQPKDKDTGQDAVRIARQNAKWQINYDYQDWQANASYVYQGERYDQVYGLGRVKLDDYSLINLGLSYNVTDNLKVSGQIDNVLDVDYETAATYIEPERRYYGSIAYSF